MRPVFIKEMARADGSFKHGNTVEIPRLSFYGNPSGTLYYIDGLLEFLQSKRAQMNEAKVCLVILEMGEGTVIMETCQLLNSCGRFPRSCINTRVLGRVPYSNENVKVQHEKTRKPMTLLGWHFHYHDRGGIALS